jgi:hypothetical protein
MSQLAIRRIWRAFGLKPRLVDIFKLSHRPTRRLRLRAELLAAGEPELWTERMAELRTIHLDEPASERDGPSVMERLAKTYAAAL